MNLASFVAKWAGATPDAPALGLGADIVCDYRALARKVATLAGGLVARGLKPGDHVAILMTNVPDYLEVLFACWHAGLAAVPVNAKLHPRELAFILQHSEARLCLATEGLAQAAAEAGIAVVEVGSKDYKALASAEPVPIRPVDPDALAWLFYTSGTTGRPKGAMLTHRNLLTMCHCYLADIDPAPPWRAILHPAPLSHGSGLYALPHLVKGSCQVLPESKGFDPAEIFDLIENWPDAFFFAAPTMIRRLTVFDEDRDVSNLKAIVYGGAPMHVADILAYLDRFGPRLCQLYGQGESPMTITGLSQDWYADRDHPDFEVRIASAGLPQTGIEVLTVDADGAPVGVGETGEIICRGDSVMAGYWRDPEATARALRDGWLWTGDVGVFDDAGFLTLKDRSKDVIITGGANVYPREVEEVLLRHPAVAEVSVIGRSDPEWGETVTAYVVVAGRRPDPDELDALCLDNIARYKRPKAYRFVEALPKNNYGKVLKTELRKREQAAAESG